MNQSSSFYSLPSSSRFAFVSASWHHEIVDQARHGFLSELAGHGVAENQVDVFPVPGAFEIPLLAQRLARSGRYAGIVAAALVVDGGIYRHDFVAATVVDALMKVQLDTDVPVFSVVLTPHHFHEHQDHKVFFAQHFVRKGEEAAKAALQIAQAAQALAAA